VFKSAVVITDGTQAGGNLFHSFSQFSIPRQIATQTFGTGRAGNLTVNAREAVDLIGVSSPPDPAIVQYVNSLFSNTGNPDNAQNSSNITVTTGLLRLLGERKSPWIIRAVAMPETLASGQSLYLLG
jgi:large exoprotein involved in heme utilization and adhesion